LYRSNFQITNQAAAAAASSFQPQDLINPFARQMDNSARKLASTLNGVVYSGAGTGTTIAGLALAIKDDNTYAGIDRSSSTHAQFRAKVIDPSTDCRNIPYLIVESPITSDRLEKSTLPSSNPIVGISTSLTSELTILPNAAPMITPTARSITFPFIANSRNSLSMEVIKNKGKIQ
jgi:hypothetical protein